MVRYDMLLLKRLYCPLKITSLHQGFQTKCRFTNLGQLTTRGARRVSVLVELENDAVIRPQPNGVRSACRGITCGPSQYEVIEPAWRDVYVLSALVGDSGDLAKLQRLFKHL